MHIPRCNNNKINLKKFTVRPPNLDLIMFLNFVWRNSLKNNLNYILNWHNIAAAMIVKCILFIFHSLNIQSELLSSLQLLNKTYNKEIG